MRRPRPLSSRTNLGPERMYLVTGGAGFIGSNLARALTARGDRVAISDWLGQGDKWKNIAKLDVEDFIAPEELAPWLRQHANRVRGVIHMGAISSTAEKNGDRILANNFKLSLFLWTWCAEHKCPFLYASSAATYGDGSLGFDDRLDRQELGRLRPLNLYGWSKHAFDRRAVRDAQEGAPTPPKWAGLSFLMFMAPTNIIRDRCAA